MNAWTDGQFERVAAWLDGAPVELTSDERALAAQVALGEKALGSALAAPMEPGLPGRVRRRVQRAQSARRFARVRYCLYGAAAAAVLVLTLGTRWMAPEASPVPSPRSAAASPMDPKEFETVPEVRQMDQQLKALEKDVSAFREPGSAPVSGEEPESGAGHAVPAVDGSRG